MTGLQRPLLRVITRLNIGGPALQALLLARELEPDYTTIVAAGRPQSHEGELNDPLVRQVDVPLVRPIHPLRDLDAYRTIKRLLSRLAPIVVHTHMAKAGAIARLAATRMPSRPIIVHTYHGHVLDGYFSRPTQEAFVRIERALASRSDALIAVSSEVRAELLKKGIGRPDQIRVIELGLDLAPYLAIQSPSMAFRNEIGIDGRTPLVATAGRLTAIKDHRTLFEAIKDLPSVHLAVLGDGELRNMLEDLSQRFGMRSRVHFVGWRDDVAGVLAAVDVVALSSLNEGTPVSLIEASAAARPVVATDVGGVSSVVENGVTGLLVEPGSSRALAKALEDTLDPDLGARLGAAGRQRVRVRFSKDRLVNDIRALYEELLAAPGAGHADAEMTS